MNPLPYPREELPITRKLSPAEACNLAGRLTGSPVTDAAEMSALAGNQVFRLRRDDGPVVFLKLADDLDLRRELAVLEILGPLGVPVPLVEAADPSGDLGGIACMLLREVDGEPADCASPEFAQAGEMLRRVHGVMLDGHGALAACPEGVHGQYQSWAVTRRSASGHINYKA